MLRDRKSSGKLVEEKAEGPFLVYFRYWFETKYREGSTIKVQFGRRTSGGILGPVYSIKSYVPGDRYIIIDIIKNGVLPECVIDMNEVHLVVDLKKYEGGREREYYVSY
jgi:hypothetical protein